MFQNLIGNKKGISIIEILAVVGIISIALSVLLGLASFSLGTIGLIKQTVKANFLAQETMEQSRNFRDRTLWNTDGLGKLIAGSNYYFQKSGSPLKWQPVAETETIDGFGRKVVFADVMRDGNDNIAVLGGINDPDTKKVTVVVSWSEKGRSHQVELITYLTNWR